ncbi:ABC transporter permease [Ferviditalea candida]|uniref:ABC transporter permease n=1 Tax=Ferviditalea candida TaxID=3108399 RepID=A0ABU5ZIX6_9BACL|nr:ABC transporter permease [Paenibacillaceae bacterium T2]
MGKKFAGFGGEFSRRFGPSIVLILLVLFNAVVTNNFLAPQTLWTILLHVSTTALVAIGMTIVIATGGVDLSVGALMAIAAVIPTLIIDANLFVLIFVTLIVAVLIGFFNGSVISNFNVQPIIVTLAMMIAGRGIALVLTDGYVTSISSPAFEFIGKGKIGMIPLPVIIMFFVVLLVYLIMKYSAFGRYVEAIGDNENAAGLAGIHVKRIKTYVYMLSAGLAALAGLIETARLGAADATNIGNLAELDAITATVVGGTLMTGGRPYIWGTVIGAILMGLITATFNMNNISYSYSLVLKAFIIILAIYLQREKQS